jgi:hypothetical protein
MFFRILGSGGERRTVTLTNVSTQMSVSVTRAALQKNNWCTDQLTAGVYSISVQYVLANICPLSNSEYKSRSVSLHDITDRIVSL